MIEGSKQLEVVTAVQSAKKELEGVVATLLEVTVKLGVRFSDVMSAVNPSVTPKSGLERIPINVPLAEYIMSIVDKVESIVITLSSINDRCEL